MCSSLYGYMQGLKSTLAKLEKLNKTCTKYLPKIGMRMVYEFVNKRGISKDAWRRTDDIKHLCSVVTVLFIH